MLETSGRRLDAPRANGGYPPRIPRSLSMRFFKYHGLGNDFILLAPEDPAFRPDADLGRADALDDGDHVAMLACKSMMASGFCRSP